MKANVGLSKESPNATPLEHDGFDMMKVYVDGQFVDLSAQVSADVEEIPPAIPISIEETNSLSTNPDPTA